jgi:hypothetical protein
MQKICTVMVTHPEDYRRRVTLLGAAAAPDALSPQLAIELARTDDGRMVDCCVSVLPVPIEGRVPTEHRLAHIPLALFVADREGCLTPDFANGARMPEVQRLALAAGAVMTSAFAV